MNLTPVEPIAITAEQLFTPAQIERLQAFMVWHQQKLMARRHRDHRCVECGHRRGEQSRSLRCTTCQSHRRERLKKMVISTYMGG